MDYFDEEDEIEISVICMSEKNSCSIGCVAVIPSNCIKNEKINLDQHEMGNILDGLQECWWELIGEFESEVSDVLENGVISDTTRDDLFKVFGHFSFLYYVGNDFSHGFSGAKSDGKIIDLGVDPDEFMYDLLTHVEVNRERS